VEIATKYGGRIVAIFAKEGDTIKAGTILARIDTSQLEAQLQAADAQVRQAESQTVEAEKVIAQRDADRIFAAQELRRTIILNRDGWATNEQLDQRRDQMQTAQAAYESAVAAVDAAKALIASWQGEARSIKSQVDDDTLVAPVSGRIQYKLAQLGEVLSPGGRVFTLLDFSDVYMTIFVPSDVAGRLTLGDEARVTLDPDPGYVFPAKVSFVATEAQFTPKTVETEEEREKLMFRVKLSAPSQLLARYAEQIKTGVRGIGYLRTDRTVAWPPKLAVKLP
jgi:HlyD family secretion protein